MTLSFEDEAVLDLIRTERMRQDAKWGGSGHDDQHTDLQWTGILARLVCEGPMGKDQSPEAIKKGLVEVAAVAVAWIEAIGRRAMKEKA